MASLFHSHCVDGHLQRRLITEDDGYRDLTRVIGERTRIALSPVVHYSLNRVHNSSKWWFRNIALTVSALGGVALPIGARRQTPRIGRMNYFRGKMEFIYLSRGIIGLFVVELTLTRRYANIRVLANTYAEDPSVTLTSYISGSEIVSVPLELGECCVCFDDEEVDGKMVLTLDCGHFLCPDCKESWLWACYQEGRDKTCPMCRRPM